jgi:high-affinity iron transporter
VVARGAGPAPRAAALAVTLLCACALAAPSGAEAAPPWQSAQRVQDLAFQAQSALLLGERRSAARLAGRAEAAFRGPLERGLRRDAAAAHRAVRAALEAAARAARGRDETDLAAARGRLSAALVRGSYAVTLTAVRAADARRAGAWLLLRDFRPSTRFTRPGVDATVAVRALAAGRSSPRRALTGVRKDLLDAYQARLSDHLGDADDAAARGFRPRWAQTAALAAGLWPILAPEYERARGSGARHAADAAFGRLERSARRGNEAAFGAARRAVAAALDGFTAAPFTDAEQARRAVQLVRFLDLVPVEYRDGTDDGRVTIPFEIQEAIAFQEGAASAFSDLEAELTRRDAARAGEVERALERLRVYVEDAGRRGRVAPEEDVEAAHEDASAALDDLIPEEWTEDDAQSDFDLVALTLDRMEAAVGAGEYRQAEQARLEAYAFFEFGPELSLRSIAPDVVARVEGLVWFGAEGRDGLAKLIAERRSRREVRETRLALDEALEEGAGALGDGAGTATVVTNAAVIVFREGLEAVLILAAVMASLSGAARSRRRPMLVGALLALLASAVTFVLAQTVLTELARYGEKLEAIVGLVAIGVLLLVLNWFFHRVYWTGHISRFHRRRRRLLALAGGGLVSAQALGFVLLGFSTVYREGFETVLFLQALELSSGLVVVLEGVLLGGIAVAAVAVATFVLERKLPYRKMLVATGVLLTAVLVIMVGKTVRTMQGVGWLPITPLELDPPYWTGVWLGVFPTVETLLAQLGAALVVVGSYVLAERLRRRSAAHRAAVARHRQRREHGDQADAPEHRGPDVVAGRRVDPERAHRVDDGGEGVHVGEPLERRGHRVDRHERRRDEAQREDRHEADRLGRLG